VDAGHGWLIFALPPAEAGCIVKMRLPGGGNIGLYQPRHPTALGKRQGGIQCKMPDHPSAAGADG
jgi:hypothetical protein